MAWQGILATAGQLAAEARVKLYVVGGFIRDQLLGRATADLDLVVEGDAITLGRRLGATLGVKVRLNPHFGTATFDLPVGQVDLTTARVERYPGPGLAPLIAASDLLTDLQRRDFTINAMARQLTPAGLGPLIDPSGGQADLGRGQLRILHADSFVDDPSRLLRGLRFAERFAFQFEAETGRLAELALAEGRLRQLLPERRAAELRSLLSEAAALPMLVTLDRLGAWGQLFEAERLPLDLAYLTAFTTAPPPFEVDRPLTRALCLAQAAGPRLIEAVGWSGWRESRAQWVLTQLEQGRAALGHAARPSQVVALLDGWPPEGLALLWLQVAEAEKQKIEGYVARWAQVRPCLTGADLLALGARPGPAIGRTLVALKAARLDGEVTSRAEEERLAMALLQLRGERDAFF